MVTTGRRQSMQVNTEGIHISLVHVLLCSTPQVATRREDHDDTSR